MSGKVIRVIAKQGTKVAQGDVLMAITAMKMVSISSRNFFRSLHGRTGSGNWVANHNFQELNVSATIGGEVENISVVVGDVVDKGDMLVRVIPSAC